MHVMAEMLNPVLSTALCFCPCDCIAFKDELSHQFASDLPAKAREGFHACSGPRNGMCAIEDIAEVEKKCNRN